MCVLVREREAAVFVGGHDGYAVWVEVCEGVNGWRDGVGGVGGREEMEEGAG